MFWMKLYWTLYKTEGGGGIVGLEEGGESRMEDERGGGIRLGNFRGILKLTYYTVHFSLYDGRWETIYI